MEWVHIIWDHTPGGNVDHVEEHDLTTDDVDYVLENSCPKAPAIVVAAHVSSVIRRMGDILLWFTKSTTTRSTPRLRTK